MKLELIGDLIETEGGGVIAELDIDDEGKAYLMQKGFEYLILRGIEQAKKEMLLEQAPLLQSHIDDALNLTVRARNALIAFDISTVEQLVSKTENYLLRRIPNISNKSVADIKDALAQVGLKLKE
jgi:DNA-directed RNA polymerase alpha subunit